MHITNNGIPIATESGSNLHTMAYIHIPILIAFAKNNQRKVFERGNLSIFSTTSPSILMFMNMAHIYPTNQKSNVAKSKPGIFAKIGMNLIKILFNHSKIEQINFANATNNAIINSPIAEDTIVPNIAEAAFIAVPTITALFQRTFVKYFTNPISINNPARITGRLCHFTRTNAVGHIKSALADCISQTSIRNIKSFMISPHESINSPIY